MGDHGTSWSGGGVQMTLGCHEPGLSAMVYLRRSEARKWYVLYFDLEMVLWLMSIEMNGDVRGLEGIPITGSIKSPLQGGMERLQMCIFFEKKFNSPALLKYSPRNSSWRERHRSDHIRV